MYGRLLIVEDDPDMAEIVHEALSPLGCPICRVATGIDALNELKTGDVGLMILDLNLPGMGGMEICRQVRKDDPVLPILILTSQQEEIDKVLGLELGADDYLTKPFSVRELVARVRALLRRIEAASAVRPAAAGADNYLSVGDLRLNLDRCALYRGEEKIEITATEFQLLSVFMKHPGRTFTREELTDAVFGFYNESFTRTLNAHLCRLREKIELDRAAPRYLLTMRGLGYRLVAPDECQ